MQYVIKKYHNLFGPTSFLNALASKPSQKKSSLFLTRLSQQSTKKLCMLPIQITSVQLFRARASDIRKQGCETFFPFLPTTYTIHYYFTYILNLIQRPKTFILLTRILSLTWWQVLCFDTKIFYGVISIKTPLHSFFPILSPYSYYCSFF